VERKRSRSHAWVWVVPCAGGWVRYVAYMRHMEHRHQSGTGVQLLVEVPPEPPALLLVLVDPLDETIAGYIRTLPP
jgi:hypothetical protein